MSQLLTSSNLSSSTSGQTAAANFAPVRGKLFHPAVSAALLAAELLMPVPQSVCLSVLWTDKAADVHAMADA